MITKEGLIKAAKEMFNNIRVDECEKDIPNLEYYNVVIVHHKNPDIRLILARLIHKQYDTCSRWIIKLPWNDDHENFEFFKFNETPHQLLNEVLELVKAKVAEKIEYYEQFLKILN